MRNIRDEGEEGGFCGPKAVRICRRGGDLQTSACLGFSITQDF